MTLKTDLFPHQREAYNKLRKIKIGALYMEQGTGKTRTALEIIVEKFNKGKVNHILWLCPCNAMKNIEKEMLKHLGSLENITIHGIETLSSSIRANVNLRRLVSSKKNYLVVDESNLVKNHKAKRTQNIQALADRCSYKMILNGTPVSRDETDLFSQWMILDWRILGYQSFWSFAANHIEWDDKIPGKVARTLNTSYLTRKIAPYTYQIKKDECLELPKKTEYFQGYDMTSRQKEEYAYVADRLLMDVDELKPYTIYRLFSGLQNVISGNYLYFKTDDKGNETVIKEPIFKNPLENPRIKELLGIIDYYDEKFIVFCKYRQEVKDIVSVLNNKYGSGSALPFDGSVSRNKRTQNIEKFEEESKFLVANKMTAGYSLNLQFCNNIIFYNNDWDYATRSQAEDRVHRIGQTREVNIIDIFANETLDERILDNLGRKASLVDEFKTLIKKMKDKKDLKALRGWIDGKETFK